MYNLEFIKNKNNDNNNKYFWQEPPFVQISNNFLKIIGSLAIISLFLCLLFYFIKIIIIIIIIIIISIICMVYMNEFKDIIDTY